MITTNDPEIADSCRVIRQHGMRRRYYHDELGFNFRMTDIHAAIGLEQLKKLDRFNQARIVNADYLSELLRGVDVPVVPNDYVHVFHQYTIRISNGKRTLLITHLKENGIGTGVYYPVPVHKQTFYTNELGYDVTLPEAEKAAEEVLSLPVHPSLNRAELKKIVKTINNFS